MERGKQKMKILVTVTDGFEDIEAIGTVALLRRAKLDVDFAAIGSTSAMGRYNVHVNNLKNLSDLNIGDYDRLVIPGGPEYVAEENNPEFLKRILSLAVHDKYIAAICAGPTILGHLGLLKGKNYTCFTSRNEDFGGTYIDRYAVRDGKIITGKSAAAVIDFSFEIIEAVLGKKARLEVEKSIYY